jgi:acyl-CoA reductase-like NAD-dependent aldehyde dehydrogenase
MAIARKEIFDPMICFLKFSTYDEVIKRPKDTQYGLAAGIVRK